MKQLKTIIKRDGQIVPYDRGRMTNAIFKAAASTGGFGFDEGDRLSMLVEQRTAESYAGQIPTVEDLQDIVEAVLMGNQHLATARAYIIYRHKRAEVREIQRGTVEATDHIPYKHIYKVLRWNIDHGCESIDGINRIIEEGEYPDLVAACEERFANECRAAGQAVLEHGDNVRLIIVAGPSSSGKTTTTIKMQEQLLAGATIQTPHYDFHSGKRTLNVHEMRLEEDEILLMDCLHGLYST